MIANGNLPRDLSFLTKEDTYSMAMNLLYSVSDNPEYSTLNELSYVLDHENFLKFIKYYGGQTIKVPTSEEVYMAMRTLLLFQYHEIEKLPWRECLDLTGIPLEDSYSCKFKLDAFKRNLNKHDYKIGGSL